MTRTTTGLCIAAALGFAVSVGAQSTTTTTPQPDQRTATHGGQSSREVTVTGCLARGADGTFMLDNARDEGMDRSRSSAGATTTTGTPNPATTTGGAATGTTGTTAGSTVGSTAAEPSGGSRAMGHEAMAWKLEGGRDLERHVGHEIQVTGRTDWNEHSKSGASTTTAGTTGSASSATTTEKGMNGPKLEVSSVKMIASSCR